MTERISLPLDLGNAFILILLNISDIKVEEDSDIDKSENFNMDIWIYLTSEREHEEFTVIGINFNIARNDGEEYLYEEDDLYFELNNVRYDDIIWMNYIYDYCVFYLRFKATNNFFFKAMFKFIKKVYREKEIRC